MTTYELRFRGDIHEPGWRTLDTFASVEALKDSLDERAARGASPGALLHVVGEGLQGTTLFVADEGGGFVPAPPPPKKMASWVGGWEGPRANAVAMLRASEGVGEPASVLAACALARTTLGVLQTKTAKKALVNALDSAERWARGEGTIAEWRKAHGKASWLYDWYYNAALELPSDRAIRAESYATRAAVSASAIVGDYAAAAGYPIADYVASTAEYVVESRRASRLLSKSSDDAAIVRKHIPLGMVLLARVTR